MLRNGDARSKFKHLILAKGYSKNTLNITLFQTNRMQVEVVGWRNITTTDDNSSSLVVFYSIIFVYRSRYEVDEQQCECRAHCGIFSTWFKLELHSNGFRVYGVPYKYKRMAVDLSQKCQLFGET